MSDPDLPPIEPGKGRLVYDKQRRTIVSERPQILWNGEDISTFDREVLMEIIYQLNSEIQKLKK